MYLTFYPKFQAFDDNGDPLNAGKVYTYESGASTTPLTTYTDAAGGTPNANPVVLNARGEADIWLSGGKLYRFVLTTSATSTIWTVDGIGGGATVVAVRDGTYTKLSSVAGTDTITATGPAEMAAYAAGQTFTFIAANTNTGAVTLNISSLGAKAITKSGTTALGAGDIPQNAVVQVSYDGTRFQFLNVAGSSSLPLSGGTMTGAITFAAGTPAKDLLDGICEGRLTLTSGTPVTTGDVTSATTVYFAPYGGNRVAVYDGSNWQLRTFTELSIAVPSTTSTPFDVFLYDNSGTLTLEATNWTNATTRATALTTQNGVLVNTESVTRRYLGTGCTTSVSGQCADSVTNRSLFNYYNRIKRRMTNAFTTGRTTSSATFTELNSEIRVQFVNGYAEDSIKLSVAGGVSISGAGQASTSIAVDSTSTSTRAQTASGTNASQALTVGMDTEVLPAVGLHYGTVLGKTNGITGTWYGGASSTTNEAVTLEGAILA